MNLKDLLRVILIATGLALAAATPRADVKGFQTIHIVSEKAGIDVFTDKIVRFYGEVNPNSERTFMEGLLASFRSPGDVVILIDSPGGYVVNGAHMIQGLLAFKPPGVRSVCVVTGEAASMAFNFLSFCDVRLALEGRELLFHKVAASGFLPFRMTEANLKAVADELARLDEPYRKRNAKLLGLSLKQYDLMASMEMALKAETLARMGYLHGIATLRLQ